MPKDILVEAHHKLSFEANVQLATQRYGSKLRKYVTEKPCTGEGAVAANLIMPIRAIRDVGRRRANIQTTAERKRRWLVYRDPIAVGDYIDNEDVFRQTGEPTSELIRNGSMAIGRGIDECILGLNEDGTIGEGGILGTIVEGKRPGGAGIALSSGNVTVHGGTGLTITKLRRARKKMGLSEVDLDRVTPVMAITQNQDDDLLGIVETGTADLNQFEQPQLRDGKVTRLMGFEFVHINGLPVRGAAPNLIRSCPVWVPDDIILGVWQDVKTGLWNDTSARNTPYWHIDAYMDCTRREDVGVHVIECVEAE